MQQVDPKTKKTEKPGVAPQGSKGSGVMEAIKHLAMMKKQGASSPMPSKPSFEK